MTNTINIGDEIGIPFPATDIDENDRILWVPIVAVGADYVVGQYSDGNRTREIGIASIGTYYQVRRRVDVVGAAIALKGRETELGQSLCSGATSAFEVFDGWDRDVFHVVGRKSGTDNRVEFRTVGGAAYADCDCRTLSIERRLCVHVAAALTVTILK